MGALTIAITGAAGLVGRAAVARALSAGHRVIAVTRGDGADLPAGVDLRQADLSDQTQATAALAGADVILHAAGRMRGTETEMLRDTVLATEKVMRAAATGGRATGGRVHVILVSSLSVYDGGQLTPGATLTEHHPVETRPELRDAYARAKIAQERVARSLSQQMGVALTILRPGIVWGPGHLWNAHLGLSFPVPLRIGGTGELPLIHIDHLAQALILACEQRPEGAVLNVLDDDRPTRARYLRALGRRALPFPWRALDLVAGWTGDRGPGLLRRPVLRSRLMPLRYSNRALRLTLNWAPVAGFETLMAAARAATPRTDHNGSDAGMVPDAGGTGTPAPRGGTKDHGDSHDSGSDGGGDGGGGGGD